MRLLFIPALTCLVTWLPGAEGGLSPRAQSALNKYQTAVNKASATHAEEIQEADDKLEKAHKAAQERVISDLLKSISSRDGFAEQARVHRAILNIDTDAKKSRDFFAAVGTLDTILEELGNEADPLGALAGQQAAASSKPAKNIDEAVEAALRFFMRHQSPNGMWDVDGYANLCESIEPKSEPGTSHLDGDGDVAVTSLILIAFFKAGHAPNKRGPYKTCIDKGLSWLIQNQHPDGSFGRMRNYENAIATRALFEARLLSKGNNFVMQAAQKGLRYLLAQQSNAGGWDYSRPNETRQDTSVTAWAAHALSSAQRANLLVQGPLSNLNRMLEGSWASCNDPTAIDHKKGWGAYPYTWNATTKEPSKSDRSALGLSIAAALNRKSSDPIMVTLANSLLDPQAPAAAEGNFHRWPMNAYWAYHASHGMQTLGGRHLEAWKGMIVKPLLESQRLGACRGGSWPNGGTDFHGNDAGPLLVTALCTLILLEVNNQ